MSWELQQDRHFNKQGLIWEWVLYGVLFAIAVFLGKQVAERDFHLISMAVMGLLAIVFMRLAQQRPFYQTMTFYLSIMAFNYYYFYCAAFTGRNPTNNPAVAGLGALPWEQAQKDVVFFIVLGIALLKLLYMHMEGKPFFAKKMNSRLLKYVGLWIVFSLVRTMLNLFEGDSLFDSMQYLRDNVEYAVIPFLLLTTLVKDEKQVTQILKGVIYTLPIVAVLGIWEFFIRGSLFTKSLGGEVIYRAVSTLQNPNNLGSYIATTLGLYSIFFVRNQLNTFEKWLFWPTASAALLCLFMTMSRSSLLFFFISISVALFIHLKTLKVEQGIQSKITARNTVVIFTVGLLLCLGILFKYFNIVEAFQDASESYLGDTGPARYRTFALWIIVDFMLSHPLGILLGYSKTAVYTAMDNSLAMLLLENGAMGFTLYLTIFIGAMRTCYRRLFSPLPQSRKAVYFAVLYLLIFQLFHGWSHFIQKSFPHALYFWTFIGIVVWLESQPVKKSTDPKTALLTESSLSLIQIAKTYKPVITVKTELPTAPDHP